MWLWAAGIIGALVAVYVAVNCFMAIKQRLARRATVAAIREFRLRRELLEARFFDMARLHGKPRGLRWVDCEWQSPVEFARDLKSGLLTAFVAVNVRFEAIEGGDMEGLAAVGTLREAVAVFHCQGGVWGTGGRALFNMHPQDAVSRLAGQYQAVIAEA